MSMTITFGWWIIPLLITACLFIGWAIWGIKMGRGGIFPDAAGGIAELGGYLVAALLSVIAWLIWAVL